MLTAERAREVLYYDDKTGVITWKVGGSGYGHRAGGVAGTVEKSGYRRIRVDGRAYAAHRIAWLLVFNELPSGYLDHRNCKRDDNRIANLRIATNSQNQANARLAIRNTSGFKGACFDKSKQRWRALIRRGGPPVSLGYFDNPRAAHEAYMRAAKEHFGEFARAR